MRVDLRARWRREALDRLREMIDARFAWIARERRATAERWRWYLMVQREALGLRDRRTADELVPLPSQPGG